MNKDIKEIRQQIKTEIEKLPNVEEFNLERWECTSFEGKFLDLDKIIHKVSELYKLLNKYCEMTLRAFLIKHDLTLAETYWARQFELVIINDYFFNYYFFNFCDIQYDLTLDVKENLIFQWYDKMIANAEKNDKIINYRSYIMGLR